jgi:hypothetical protein
MFPARPVAGDTLSFTTSLADYPASSWTLNFRLIPRSGDAAIDIACTADGDDHVAEVSAATTALWPPGTYDWAAYVEGGSTEVYTVGTGATEVRPDPRTVAPGTDLRSQAEIALADARAAFAAWTPTRRMYRIGDRQMEFSTAAEILAVIDYWQREVKRETLATTENTHGRRVYVRMARA